MKCQLIRSLSRLINPQLNKTNFYSSLGRDVNNLTLGVVQEEFGWEGRGVDTDRIVKEAALNFQKLGAKVREIPIPLHRDGYHIWAVICNDGGFQQVVQGNGFGTGWKGYYPTSAITFFAKAGKVLADNFPDTIKQFILLAHYMVTRYQGRYYAKARNQMSILCQAYDQALKEVDLLVMPTTAPSGKALPLPENPARKEFLQAC